MTLHSPAAQIAKIIAEISKPSKPVPQLGFENGCFYCEQAHEIDEILLLNRPQNLHKQG